MSAHHDLLAELELTMVPSLRSRPEPSMYVPDEGARGGTCRRTFWCSLKQEEAEVEFAKKSILGFPRLVGVRSCSIFNEPENVACGRHCLNSKFRRQWPFALPIIDRRHPLGG